MARNLYDLGDARPDQNGQWLNDKREGSARVLPVRMLLVALTLGLAGMTLIGNILPSREARPAATGGPIIISTRFAACDDLAGAACVLSPDSYAYQGRRYHLADISVPQQDGAHCPQEAERARQGRIALLSMMNGGSFEARADPADANPGARLLMRDGVSLGSLMVIKGHARAWSATPIDWCAP